MYYVIIINAVFVVDFMHAEERTSHSSGNANPERAC